MAGTGRKVFGTLVLITAILLLLGGGGAAGFGWYDEQQNQDEAGFFGPDPDRSEFNEMLMVAGGAGALLGLILLVVGLVLLVSGSRASDLQQPASNVASD